jgi:hypothetical protein
MPARIGDQRDEQAGDRRQQARQRVRDELGTAYRHADMYAATGRADRMRGAADDRAANGSQTSSTSASSTRGRRNAGQLAGQRVRERRVDVAARDRP